MEERILRPWQASCLNKARHWFMESDGETFVVNAAPGAGKTLAACAIAKSLLQENLIDRVIVIAPRSEVVNQWSTDFDQITGRFMGKVTGRDEALLASKMDLCATWAALQGLATQLQEVCSRERVFLICDEHHHAALEKTWGSSADHALALAKYTLVLTGTPIRSDGEEMVWLDYDSKGTLRLPPEATYTLTYGEAVDLGYCRPATFHRHEGHFQVDAGDGTKISVSGQQPAELSGELKRVPGLDRALDFYKLARTPQFEDDGESPCLNGYQGSMLLQAASKLDQIRERMPNAGGLVIAPDIEMAKYMAHLLSKIEGESVQLVHSQLPNADQKIKAFRKSSSRWLVSVAMVSEGVDINRLRVLVYLPNAMTELAFRQALGRVVRTNRSDDDSRAYVVMPSLEKFDLFAKRVEDEMPPAVRFASTSPKGKKCPICETENDRGAHECIECGHHFPAAPERTKQCHGCGQSNELQAEQCVACGESFLTSFDISLKEALRDGAIVRGMELSEDAVQSGEKIAAQVRRQILHSGDEKLISIISQLPEESWGHLKEILSAA